MAGDSYRDELAAARHRARTLEAQLAEKDAAVDAREAELSELREKIARLERGEHEPADEGEHQPADERKEATRKWVLPAVAAALLAVAGGMVLLRAPEAPPEPRPGPEPPRPSAVEPAPVAPAPTGRTLLWHGTPSKRARETDKSPAVRDVNGDGLEDVVGLVFTPGKDGHVFAGAFSGVDAQPLWLSEPLGWLPEGIGDAYLTVSGDVALSHATDGTLRVHALRSGEVRASQRPKSPVVELCEGEHGPIARLKTGALIAWRDGKLRTAPGGCVGPASPVASGSPKTDDFRPVSFARSPDAAFAFGRTGRLKQPAVVAYEPGTGLVKWRLRATGSPDRLAAAPWQQHVFAYANQSLYVELEPAELAESGPKATGERLLTCLDAATGAARWTADISANGALASAFVPGDKRLVLVRQTRVDLLDARDGKSVGHIGWH